MHEQYLLNVERTARRWGAKRWRAYYSLGYGMALSVGYGWTMRGALHRLRSAPWNGPQ